MPGVPDIDSPEAGPSDCVPLRRRVVHAGASAAAIVLVCWWSWFSNPDPTLRDVLADPDPFEGQTIEISSEPLIESVGAESFLVRSEGVVFEVAGRIDAADAGQFVHVRGVFRPVPPGSGPDGRLELAHYRVVRGRRAKIWISLIPVFWVAGLLLRHFRVNRRDLAIEPRC